MKSEFRPKTVVIQRENPREVRLPLFLPVVKIDHLLQSVISAPCSFLILFPPQPWGLVLASSRDGHVFVRAVVDNSPAARAFVRPGMEVRDCFVLSFFSWVALKGCHLACILHCFSALPIFRHHYLQVLTVNGEDMTHSNLNGVQQTLKAVNGNDVEVHVKYAPKFLEEYKLLEAQQQQQQQRSAPVSSISAPDVGNKDSATQQVRLAPKDSAWPVAMRKRDQRASSICG